MWLETLKRMARDALFVLTATVTVTASVGAFIAVFAGILYFDPETNVPLWFASIGWLCALGLVVWGIRVWADHHYQQILDERHRRERRF